MNAIKTLTIVSALALASFGSAHAAGIGGGIVVGGVGQVWQGDVSGKATSISNGNAIAASQVTGNGASFQHTDAISGGSATIGGSINNVGAQVGEITTQFATVNSFGQTSGNAPGSTWNNGSEMIVNGTMGFASSENMAKGKANFNVGQIGGIVGIGGVAAIGNF